MLCAVCNGDNFIAVSQVISHQNQITGALVVHSALVLQCADCGMVALADPEQLFPGVQRAWQEAAGSSDAVPSLDAHALQRALTQAANRAQAMCEQGARGASVAQRARALQAARQRTSQGAQAPR